MGARSADFKGVTDGTETLHAATGKSLARHGPNMSSGNMGHFNTNLHFIEPPPSLHSSLLADRDRQRPPAPARACGHC